jgi:hypothetical protein
MTDKINPVATEHLPSFVTAPGQTDVLLAVMAVILAASQRARSGGSCHRDSPREGSR